MKKTAEGKKGMPDIKKICLIGISGLAIAAILAGLLCQMYENHLSGTEKVVRNYLQEYQPICQEEIRMLSEELDSIIGNKTTDNSMTEKEKDELIHAVCKELERATYNIPEQEIKKMAYQILESHTGTETEELMQYQTGETDPEKEPEVPMTEKKTGITGKDIRRIASSLDWTEDEITALIRENLSVTDETLKETAETLGISVHDLNRMIAENREYTDSLYLSLGTLLSSEASQLKMLAGQSENSAEDISYLARKLKITEGKLNAEIAKSKAFSDSEIEALANELQISAEELRKLIYQHMELTDDSISQISQIFAMDIENFREQTGRTFSDMEEEIRDGIRRLEEADSTLEQSMSDAADAAEAVLEETKNNLLGMIDSNQASITATGQALQETEAALGAGLENIRGSLEAQGETTARGMGDIHNRINSIQEKMETYRWETDESGAVKLTVSIPKEEEEQ